MRILSRTGRTFVEMTKYQYQIEKTDQSKLLPQPELADALEPGMPVFDLPDPKNTSVPSTDLFAAINNRVSERRYSDVPLSLEELSYLLWCTQGVRQVTSRPATLRTVPSAGSRHPFETYLLINKVEGLEPGLYRYHALEHKLVQLSLDAELKAELTKICHNQGMVTNSAVTFIWAAEIYRMYWRYVERGYRYLYIDAGHVCQNLYLACEPMGTGCCAIGAFDDDALATFLGIDGEHRIPIYIATVGKKIAE